MTLLELDELRLTLPHWEWAMKREQNAEVKLRMKKIYGAMKNEVDKRYKEILKENFPVDGEQRDPHMF